MKFSIRSIECESHRPSVCKNTHRYSGWLHNLSICVSYAFSPRMLSRWLTSPTQNLFHHFHWNHQKSQLNFDFSYWLTAARPIERLLNDADGPRTDSLSIWMLATKYLSKWRTKSSSAPTANCCFSRVYHYLIFHFHFGLFVCLLVFIYLLKMNIFYYNLKDTLKIFKRKKKVKKLNKWRRMNNTRAGYMAGLL